MKVTTKPLHCSHRMYLNTSSKEQQLNERISTLKKFMNNALSTDAMLNASLPLNSPSKSPSSIGKLINAYSPTQTHGLNMTAYSDLSTLKSRSVSYSDMYQSKRDYSSIDTAVIDETEELKILRDSNHNLGSKIVHLEDSINSYAVKLQFASEEVRDLEQKLKVCRHELDDEIEKRRAVERELQEDLRSTQHQLEELQTHYELLEQKEKSASESRLSLEAVNRELEKSTTDKSLMIADLQKELSQKKMEIEDLEQLNHQLKNEKKHLEEDLLMERKNRERDLSDMQEEIYALNDKGAEKIRRLQKEVERERMRYDQVTTHFKTQVTGLEEQAEGLKNRLLELQNENAQLVGQIQTMSQRERFYKGKLESFQDMFSEHKTQHALLQQSYLHLTKEKEQLQNQEKKLRQDITDQERKQENESERYKKDAQRVDKQNKQLQLRVQQLVQQVATLESKNQQLEQTRTSLQTLVDKTEEQKREEVTRIAKQLEKVQTDKKVDSDNVINELNALREQNARMKREMQNQEQVFQKQIELLHQEIHENEQYEEALNGKQEEVAGRMAQLTSKLKRVEEENEILLQKTKASTRNRDAVNERLKQQNELLRESVDELQRERDNLEQKLKRMKEQEELLSLRDKKRISEIVKKGEGYFSPGTSSEAAKRSAAPGYKSPREANISGISGSPRK